MIKIGVCTGLENIRAAKRAGFEYLEFSLSVLTRATEPEFYDICQKINDSGLPVEVCNGMLPGDFKIVGPNVNAQTLREYLSLAFDRARLLGAKVVVFGSGGARSIPDGWAADTGWRQIANFLQLAEKHAEDADIQIAIEPLRKMESNLLNYVSEATLMASLLQLKNVRVLGDTFHMAVGAEPLSALTTAGSLLAHVHVANPIGRAYPKRGDGEDYSKLFRALTDGGYDGRVSVEALYSDFEAEAAEAYQALAEARERGSAPDTPPRE